MVVLLFSYLFYWNYLTIKLNGAVKEFILWMAVQYRDMVEDHA